MFKIKPILFTLWLFLVIFLVLFAIILFGSTPEKAKNIILFYSSVFGSTFTLLTLIGFYFRRLMGNRELVNYYLAIAARQALWLALGLVISLFLLSLGWFTWLNVTFLVLALIFFEGYLITKHGRES